MNRQEQHDIGVFFDTPSAKCSYYPGERMRRQMGFIEPLKRSRSNPIGHVRAVVKDLIPQGFLDTGLSARFNACGACKKCFPVRINLAEFEPSRSQRRILKRNKDLTVAMKSLFDENGDYALNREHFDLMHHNAVARHPGESFATMGYEGFRNNFSTFDMVAETRDEHGTLMNFTILSAGDDYMYGINFFYDIEESKRRSLGKHTILALAEALKDVEQIKYFYLGSLAQDSPKLSYKAEFSGLEAMTTNGWVPYDAEQEYKTPDYSEVVPQHAYWPYRSAHKHTNG